MERGGHFSLECASCVLGEGRVEQSGPRRHDELGLQRIPAFAEPFQVYGVPYSKKSSDPPPRDGVRPLAFFRVAIVQGSS